MKTGIKLVDDVFEKMHSSNEPDKVPIKLEDVVFQRNENPLNKIQCDVVVSPTSLKPVYRIMVPSEIFPHLHIVCNGNSIDIHTESMDDGRYKVKRKLNVFKPVIDDDEMIVEVFEFESTKEFIKWVESLSRDMVEAYRQIYYDRWNFGTGNYKDRMYFDLLDEEYQGRR